MSWTYFLILPWLLVAAQSWASVGLVRLQPGFQVFYMENERIVVKDCEGKFPVVKSPADCKGPETRVDVTKFIQLVDKVIVSDLDRIHWQHVFGDAGVGVDLKPALEWNYIEKYLWIKDRPEYEQMLKDLPDLRAEFARQKEVQKRIQHFVDEGGGEQAKDDLRVINRKVSDLYYRIEDIEGVQRGKVDLERFHQIILEKISDPINMPFMSPKRNVMDAIYMVLYSLGESANEQTCGLYDQNNQHYDYKNRPIQEDVGIRYLIDHCYSYLGPNYKSGEMDWSGTQGAWRLMARGEVSGIGTVQYWAIRYWDNFYGERYKIWPDADVVLTRIPKDFADLEQSVKEVCKSDALLPDLDRKYYKGSGDNEYYNYGMRMPIAEEMDYVSNNGLGGQVFKDPKALYFVDFGDPWPQRSNDRFVRTFYDVSKNDGQKVVNLDMKSFKKEFKRFRVKCMQTRDRY